MLKHDHLVAKIGVDTAENEPSNVCRSKQAPPTPGHKCRSDNRIRYEEASHVTPSCTIRMHDKIAKADITSKEATEYLYEKES